MDKKGTQTVKIYFACSVRDGRDDKHIYEQLVRFLQKSCEVLTEFNVDKDLTPLGTPGATSKTYKRDMSMLKQSEAMIAEVTMPSLGVGYEIAKAEEINIPILALYRPQLNRSLSAMIDGSPDVTVGEYGEIPQAEQIVNEWLENLS